MTAPDLESRNRRVRNILLAVGLGLFAFSVLFVTFRHR